MSQAWTQSPFRLSPVEDDLLANAHPPFGAPLRNDTVACGLPLLLGPVNTAMGGAAEEGGLYTVDDDMEYGFPYISDPPALPRGAPWPPAHLPGFAAPVGTLAQHVPAFNLANNIEEAAAEALPLFHGAVPGNSTMEQRHAFRNSVLRAVDEIESGHMDDLLCPLPMHDSQDAFADCLEPLQNLAINPPEQTAPGWFRRPSQAPSSTPDIPRTPTRVSPARLTACSSPTANLHISTAAWTFTESSFGPTLAASRGCPNNWASRPGTPSAPDLAAANSAAVPSAAANSAYHANASMLQTFQPSFAAGHAESAELAANLHLTADGMAAMMARSTNVHGHSGADDAHPYMRALSCPVSNAWPQAGSAPHTIPPQHLASISARPTAPKQRLVDNHLMTSCLRYATASEAGPVLEREKDKRASYLSASVPLPCPPPAALTGLLHCGGSDGGPSDFPLAKYGQSDNGCLTSWTARHHPRMGGADLPEELLLELAEAGNLFMKRDLAPPFVPADNSSAEPSEWWPSAPRVQPPASGGRPSDSASTKGRKKAPAKAPVSTQKSKITKHDLRKLFQLPIDKARKEIGVAKNAFKKVLDSCGFKRWPQRQLVGLQNLMDNVSGDSSLSPQLRQARLLRIKLNICAIMDGTAHSIFEDLSKASHVYHNRLHQVRSTHRAPQPDDNDGMDPSGSESPASP